MQSTMRVKLITHTPEPEKTIAAAASLCYSPKDITSLLDEMNDEIVQRLINMLAKLGHESPFEHISFTFGIEGVSRSLTHQLVRHRIGSSYSQKSQRYVKEGAFEYIVPPEIQKKPEVLAIYEEAMKNQQTAYDEIVELLKKEYFNDQIKAGKTEKQANSLAEKKAIEDARFVLPNACETKIIVTMNARALFNFFYHRCCNRAQWEIRNLADEMLKLVKMVAPTVFKYSGPNCLHAPCPEGDMTCGEIDKVRNKYNG